MLKKLNACVSEGREGSDGGGTVPALQYGSEGKEKSTEKVLCSSVTVAPARFYLLRRLPGHVFSVP